MSKYLQLQIPEPCHENWNEMTPSLQGRYCSSCKKSVIDFTLMDDDDLLNFFKKPKENVCGRFNQQQLNTDILIPSRKIPWIKYFFQIAIPAFLFTSKGVAQGSVKVVQKHVVDKKRVKSEIIPEPVTCNVNANNIPNAISPKNELPMLRGSVGGLVVRVGGVSYGTTIKQRKSFTIPFLTRANSFIIFPNPVVSNSKLSIKWKKAIVSDQTISIYNEAGTLLQGEVIRVKENTLQHELHLNQLSHGTYILRITDTKTRKSSSQQFIVL